MFYVMMKMMASDGWRWLTDSGMGSWHIPVDLFHYEEADAWRTQRAENLHTKLWERESPTLWKQPKVNRWGQRPMAIHKLTNQAKATWYTTGELNDNVQPCEPPGSAGVQLTVQDQTSFGTPQGEHDA